MKKSTIRRISRHFTFLVALLLAGTGIFNSKGDLFVFEGPGYYYTCECWGTWDGMWECECSGWEAAGWGDWEPANPWGGNNAPTADASATLGLVISSDGVNATVMLNGSRSWDPEGDLLSYTWYMTGSSSVLATGAVASVTLPVGTNSITLAVADWYGDWTITTISIEVISPGTAVGRLMLAFEETVLERTKQPLFATLSAAKSSFDRGNFAAALNQLSAFQNKVQVQVAPANPTLAADLTQAAQDIIDALNQR